MKSVRIRSYSGTYFFALGLNTERYGCRMPILSPNAENADQNNSEYGHFLCSESLTNHI